MSFNIAPKFLPVQQPRQLKTLDDLMAQAGHYVEFCMVQQREDDSHAFLFRFRLRHRPRHVSRGGGDEGRDGFITLSDLFFQGFDELPGLAHPERIGIMLGVVAFADEQLDELATALGQIGQLLLLR